MKIWAMLNKTDKLTLLIVAILTALSYVAIALIVAFTSVTLSIGPVVMVTGWLFGAVMTFSFHKYREVRSSI